MNDPKIEANDTGDTAPDSFDSNENAAAQNEEASSLPVIRQPQLAFVANIDDNGGPITGSLVYLSDPSSLTTTFGPSGEGAALPNHALNDAGGNVVDPFLALLQNQSSGYDAPPATPMEMSLVRPLTSSTTTAEPVPTQEPAPQSFRTRRRKRNTTGQQQQQDNQAQRPANIPPHHRNTDTQVVWNNNTIHDTTQQAVWTGGTASLKGKFMVPVVFTSSGQPQPPPPGPHHRLTSELTNITGTTNGTDGTTLTPVTREVVSGDTNESSLPSVHFLRNGTEGLRHHLHHVVRNSRRMEVVNYEQIERVKMMHQRFAEGSRFSFNYNTLLLTASVLAALGLASNSGTTVIASMLVSPIMGPVVGMAYGATIHDTRLVKEALKTELLSLLCCIVIGAVVGACTGRSNLSTDWPTDEMYVRGTWQNFLVALPVAFFSGLGVAVGLLDDQVSSLVGVAISASLLPPAVNSGILWVAFTFVDLDWWNERPVPFFAADDPSPPREGEPDDDTWRVVYDDDTFSSENGPEFEERYEYRNAGMISLLLTLANIVLVALASMIMFRLKERLPIEKKVFWNDLGVARKIYRNLALMSNDDDDDDDSQALASPEVAVDINSSSTTTTPNGSVRSPQGGETMYGIHMPQTSNEAATIGREVESSMDDSRV